MDTGQHDHEEEPRERPRPRVVDKRVSARSPGEQPASETPPAGSPAPEAGAPSDDRLSGAGSGSAEPEARAVGQEAPSPGGQSASAGAAEPVWTPEQEAEARRIAEEITRVHGRDWVVSMAMNLANVAGVKIEAGTLDEASLAIDALAGIVNQTAARLGDAEAPLRQLLSQLQMAYAQATVPPPSP